MGCPSDGSTRSVPAEQDQVSPDCPADISAEGGADNFEDFHKLKLMLEEQIRTWEDMLHQLSKVAGPRDRNAREGTLRLWSRLGTVLQEVTQENEHLEEENKGLHKHLSRLDEQIKEAEAALALHSTDAACSSCHGVGVGSLSCSATESRTAGGSPHGATVGVAAGNAGCCNVTGDCAASDSTMAGSVTGCSVAGGSTADCAGSDYVGCSSAGCVAEGCNSAGGRVAGVNDAPTHS